MSPKARLVIIGGAEHKGNYGTRLYMKTRNRNFRHYEILGELLPKSDHENHRIEVVTTASSIPDEVSVAYRTAFRTIGFQNVHHISIREKEEAKNPEFIERVATANAVLFSGGDQLRLSTILGGTEFIHVIQQRYMNDENFIVAGTSAGAMVMSKLMIYSGRSNEALLVGDLHIASGFGFLDGCIVDTHFIKRGRFGRLAQALIMNPTCIGIGLGEDTALIIKNGNECECRGSGMVIVIDGQDMGYTNVAVAPPLTPLCVENLRVHILARGDGYNIQERKFVKTTQAERNQIEQAEKQQIQEQPLKEKKKNPKLN